MNMCICVMRDPIGFFLRGGATLWFPLQDSIGYFFQISNTTIKYFRQGTSITYETPS